MKLIRCDQCERTEPVDQAYGWVEVAQDGGKSTWHFCSVKCLAAWSGEAI